MHRQLPDFVNPDQLKTNFYEDEKNAHVILEGLKFLRHIEPDLIKSIPLSRDMLKAA